MESDIKNEKFILISENLSFKEFLSKTAKTLNVNPPTKEAKPWLLNMAWRLDWLSFKLFGKRRQLAKQTAKSAISVTKYDNTKVKKALNYNFKDIDKTISQVSQLFSEDFS